MSNRPKSKAVTIGSTIFDPNQLLDSWKPEFAPQNDNLKEAIQKTFGLKQNDNYVYHAIASVTLAQVQVAIEHGGSNGMHAWYRDEAGNQVTQNI